MYIKVGLPNLGLNAGTRTLRRFFETQVAGNFLRSFGRGPICRRLASLQVRPIFCKWPRQLGTWARHGFGGSVNIKSCLDPLGSRLLSAAWWWPVGVEAVFCLSPWSVRPPPDCA